MDLKKNYEHERTFKMKIDIPNKLPMLLNEYKEKNHLTNIEMIKQINDLISNPQDRIQLKVDDYGKDIPFSSFNSFIAKRHSTRPKNVFQRNAIIQLLDIPYIKTIFSDGNEVIEHLEKCYDVVIDNLKEIQQKSDLFRQEKNIYTRDMIKEMLIESSSIDWRAVAGFIWHFVNLLKGFEATFSPFNAIYGYLLWEELSKSDLILTLNELVLNQQIEADTKFVSLLLANNEKILDHLIYDITDYKSDFFITFKYAKISNSSLGNPMLYGQYPVQFIPANLYSDAAHRINNLSYTKNEKRAVLNASFNMLEDLFDILGESLSSTTYMKVFRF